MLNFTLTFILSTVLFNYQTNIPEKTWILFLGVTCLIIFFFFRKSWLSGLFIGFLYSFWFALHNTTWDLPPTLVKKDVTIIGTVAKLPEFYPEKTKLVLKAHKVEHFSQQQSDYVSHPNQMIELSYYKEKLTQVRPGQELKVVARLKPVRRFANPGGFDYEKKQFANKVAAVGYIREIVSIKPSEKNKFWLNSKRHDWVNHSPLSSEKLIYGRFIKALTVGQKYQLNKHDWQVFQKTGTGHLLAISGLHIGLITFLIYSLIFNIWKRWPAGCLTINAHLLACVTALLVAWMYGGLAGFSVPTLRACVMVTCLTLTLFNRYKVHASESLALACLVILMINPRQVLLPGFWLSFITVSILIYGLSNRINIESTKWTQVKATLKGQWLITLGLLPLTIAFFHQFSLISFAANLFAIPYTSFIVLPLALLSCAFIPWSDSVAQILLKVTDISLAILWSTLELIAELPKSQLWLTIPDNLSLTITFLACLILLSPRGFPAKSLALIGLLGLCFPRIEPIPVGTLKLTVLDVGQGTAIVVQTHKHTLVYDTGAGYPSGFNLGSAVVAPFLRQQGVQQVDKVIVSHGDNDHAGGLQGLLSQVRVKKIATGEPNRIKGISLHQCLAGQAWQWDKVLFKVVHPQPNALQGRKSNNNSCVLIIKVGKHKVLLPGDIESDVEYELLSTQKAFNKEGAWSIVVVPHHGSKTSSTQEFVERIKPKYAVLTAGYMNRYRLPRQEIVQRYKDQGSLLYNTAYSGAVQFKLNPSLPVNPPKEFRKLVKRYWHSERYDIDMNSD